MFHCWVRANGLCRDELRLSGIFYMVLITNVSVATCNTQWFVWLERIAAKRHRQGQALPLPWCLRPVDYIFDCRRCHFAHTYNVRQVSTGNNEVQLSESKAMMQHANEYTSYAIYPLHKRLKPLCSAKLLTKCSSIFSDRHDTNDNAAKRAGEARYTSAVEFIDFSTHKSSASSPHQTHR